MFLYNTLAHKKQSFKSIRKGKVGMYACGPTVYSAPHIGNFRAYLEQDVLKRVLTHEGYAVDHVLNITDVGHLVGDANLGEDKVKLAAEREHKTARQVADFYTELFLGDMKKLNIIPPTKMPKATDHIKEMIEMIEVLEKKGYLYTVPTGVYFDTSKFKEYGKLTKMTFKKLNLFLKAGARVERAAGLRNITDFAVWRFRKSESKDDMVYDTKWGEGFPGWHIECSAMSIKYLGETFDIHCGGVDHIPIHHTNEIAQSEAATEKKFVNYWVHNNFLTVDGGKMAKSIGNVYTISMLEEKGFSPTAVRYMLISAHYRKKLNFTLEALKNVSKTLVGIYSFLQRLQDLKSDSKQDKDFQILVKESSEAFFKQLENDLNVPAALSAMHGLITETNRKIESDSLSTTDAKLVLKTMLEFDEILGLEFEKNSKQNKKEIKGEIEGLINEREKARLSKDFKRSDEIRDLLKNNYKIIVEDTKDGQKWHKMI